MSPTSYQAAPPREFTISTHHGAVKRAETYETLVGTRHSRGRKFKGCAQAVSIPHTRQLSRACESLSIDMLSDTCTECGAGALLIQVPQKLIDPAQLRVAIEHTFIARACSTGQRSAHLLRIPYY
jgi:hypothetical protein